MTLEVWLKRWRGRERYRRAYARRGGRRLRSIRLMPSIDVSSFVTLYDLNGTSVARLTGEHVKFIVIKGCEPLAEIEDVPGERVTGHLSGVWQ